MVDLVEIGLEDVEGEFFLVAVAANGFGEKLSGRIAKESDADIGKGGKILV